MTYRKSHQVFYTWKYTTQIPLQGKICCPNCESAVSKQHLAFSPFRDCFSCRELPHPRLRPSAGGPYLMIDLGRGVQSSWWGKPGIHHSLMSLSAQFLLNLPSFHRCGAHGHSLINSLNPKGYLRICFPENPTWNVKAHHNQMAIIQRQRKIPKSKQIKDTLHT